MKRDDPKIRGDDPAPKGWHNTLCGKWKSKDTHYRVPFWCFERLVFSLVGEEEKKSLCSICVKEFLYLHWIKGEKKKGSIFPWVDLSGKDISNHLADSTKYLCGFQGRSKL